jgi:hypothetical protein
MQGTQFIRSSKTLTLTFFFWFSFFLESCFSAAFHHWLCVFIVYIFWHTHNRMKTAVQLFSRGKIKQRVKIMNKILYTSTRMNARERKWWKLTLAKGTKIFQRDIMLEPLFEELYMIFIPPFSSILLFAFFLPAHTRHIIVALSY